MSLLHLLTVGQSFKGVEDRPGNYRMDHSLPKFESSNRLASLPPTRNSVPTVAKTAPAPVQTSLFSELVGGPAVRAHAAQPISQQKPAVPAPPLQAPVLAPIAKGSAVSQAPAAPLFEKRPKDNKWKTMVKELFFGRRRRRPNGANVQTELALENVTVVRNDLHETDLVAVPTRAQTFVTSKPVVPPHKQARDWVRLTAGLIRPKKSEFHPSQGVASAAEQNQTPDLIARR